MNGKRKKIIIILIAVLLAVVAVLFVPFRTETWVDGQTKAYSSVMYKIVKWKGSGTSIYWIPNNYKSLFELMKDVQPEILNEQQGTQKDRREASNGQKETQTGQGENQTDQEETQNEPSEGASVNSNSHPVPYKIPEIPEGYALVFRKVKDTFPSSPVAQVTKYEYDANGLLIREVLNDGLGITEYFYDEKNHLIKEIWHDDYKESITTYEYDSQGREVKRSGEYGSYERVYSQDGLTCDYYGYSYSSDSDPTQNPSPYYSEKFDSEGRLVSSSSDRVNDSYEYDEYGELIKVNSTVWEGGYLRYVPHEYFYESDADGVRRCVKEIKRTQKLQSPYNVTESLIFYHYDSCGRLIQKEFYSEEEDGVRHWIETFDFDQYGNLLEEDSHRFEYQPFVIPIDMMTDEDKARISDPGNP